VATLAVATLVAAVSAIIVTALLALRSVSTVVTRVARGSSGRVDVSTASRDRVVGVRRRVDSSSIVTVLDGNGVSDGLGHALARVGRVRVGVGLSLGDNILTGVSRLRLVRLAGLGRVRLAGLRRVGVERHMRLAGLVVRRLSVYSNRADSCGNGDGLGGDVTNRAVDNGRRALSDGVCLGAVNSAGGVLSRLGSVARVSVDSREANVSACLGRRGAVDNSVLVVVSVGNSGRSSNDDS
jgi:hypothetical protein